MTKPNSSSPKDTNSPMYQTMTWGIIGESTESPHSKRVISYCIISSDYYATTDGHSIAFWKPHSIIKIFSIPATALFFFPKISNVAAYVRGSHQLHFISITHPFQIRVHPLHFSDSKIFSFYYFKTTSALVSAGDGILFTRVIIPPYFKDTQPMPETFQFEKISLYYEGIKFKGPNNPRFVENSNFGIVLVNVNDTIHIHTSNGTEVQVISNLFISDHISSLSLLSFSNLYSNSNSNSLVIGTNSGNVSILRFELPDPFVPNAPSESCKNIKTYKITNFPILLSELFDRNFLVTVDSDRTITIFGIQNESVIQQFKCSIEAIGGFFAFDKLILFSQFMISIYHCSFFLNHFSDVGSNAIDMFRAVSETRSARIVCTLENCFISFFSPKDGKQIFGFTTGQGYPNIRSICYTRDVEIDGLYSTKRMCEDVLFCHLDQGMTSFLHLDQIDRTNYSNRADIFRSTITNFNMSWIPSPFIEDHDIINQFVSFIDIGHDEVCGIVETGNIYIFSSSTNKLVSTFSLNEKDIICAIYSFSNDLLIISAIRKLFTFNIRTRRIVSSFDDCFITSLLLIDRSTLFCGCANGFVEIRNFPSLSVRVNSSLYNTCHTEDGHRNPLQETYLSTRQLYTNPSAVKKLDFCQRREIVLSLSSYGEIFLWDRNGKPVTRISIPFGAKSACFADGTGSILISSMETLFKIDWTSLFKKQLLPMQTPLDDFDLRIDSFDMKHVNNREPPIILTVSNEEKFIFYENEDQDEDDENELNFEELKIEMTQIPKRFFAPLNQDELEEQNAKKIVPLQDIDEIIENERKLEAEKNKKKKEPKEIKVKSRRGENKRDSLFESNSKPESARSSNKYAAFYDDDDDDEPKSARRYKKKAKKSVKKSIKEVPVKNKSSLSLMSKGTFDKMSNFDRFNAPKKTRKRNPRFEQPEFSKSLQQLPTINEKIQPKLAKSMTSDNESVRSATIFKKTDTKIEKKLASNNNITATKKSIKKNIVKKSQISKKKESKFNIKNSTKKKNLKPNKNDDDDDSATAADVVVSADSAELSEKEDSLITNIEFQSNREEELTTQISNNNNNSEINTSNLSTNDDLPDVVINIPSFIFHQDEEEEEENVNENHNEEEQKTNDQNALKIQNEVIIESSNTINYEDTEIDSPIHKVHEPEPEPENKNEEKDEEMKIHEPEKQEQEIENKNEEEEEMRIHEPEIEVNSPPNEKHESPRIRQKIQASKANSQSFITQPDEVSIDTEEEEKNNANDDDDEKTKFSASSKISSLSDHSRKSGSKTSSIVGNNDEFCEETKQKMKKIKRYSNISKSRAVDDEMFSNFRIDGFDFPFGGYALKAGRGVVSVGDNAPLLMVSSSDKKQKKLKNGKGINVKKVTKHANG